MELSKFENGIECQVNKIRENIQNKGVHVQREGGYSYTAGMNQSSLPELVLYPGPDVTDADIEDLFCEMRMVGDEERFTSIAKHMNVALKKVDELEKRRVFYSARLLYGHWDFSAKKLVWGE